jgi:hypothetical protein
VQYGGRWEKILTIWAKKQCGKATFDGGGNGHFLFDWATHNEILPSELSHSIAQLLSS